MVNFDILGANFLEQEMFRNLAIWTIYEYMHFVLDNYDYWWGGEKIVLLAFCNRVGGLKSFVRHVVEG